MVIGRCFLTPKTEDKFDKNIVNICLDVSHFDDTGDGVLAECQ